MTFTEREIPLPSSDIHPEQLALFNFESLRADLIGPFDPAYTRVALQNQQNRQVMAIDIGADKIIAATHRIHQGQLIKDDEYSELLHEERGNNYVDFLEKVSHFATEQDIPVGISSAGKYEGGKLTRASNLPIFVKDLQEKYDGDLKKIFPTLGLYGNDTVIGLVSGSIAALDKNPNTENVLFMIAASGIGAAVLVDGQLFHVEPGHIPVVPDLNPQGQTMPCGILGAEYVCLERVAASRAGIEPLYYQQSGEHLDGRGISARFQQGDKLAAELYDNSAKIVAHAIVGVGNVFSLWQNPDALTVIYHGGTFNVPGYADRITSIVKKEVQNTINVVRTNDGENLCLKGAAIAALQTITPGS